MNSSNENEPIKPTLNKGAKQPVYIMGVDTYDKDAIRHSLFWL